jgi:hypothetical protein
MKLTQTLIASAVLVATSSIAMAASDTTDITINVTKDAYVNLLGSLNSNITKTLSLADVNGATTTLGDLGAESNTVAGCDVTFSSLNDFKLVHGVDATKFLHDAAKYTVDWAGTSIASGATNTVALADCNTAASNMTMTTPNLPAVVQAGTYSDKLTVTIVTQ